MPMAVVFPGLTLERASFGFGFGGVDPHACGPAGIVFAPGLEWLVANCGTGELFRLRGLDVPAVEPIRADCGVLDLAVGPAGRLFGSRSSEIVEVDPRTGVILRTVASGFSELAGLSYDVRTGRILVADFKASALCEVDPDTGHQSVRASGALLGSPDGIVLGDDGRLFVAGYASKHVLAVDEGGVVTDLGMLPGRPDGIALGGPDGPFAGSVIVNQRDGAVVALGPEGEITPLGIGGTPGDLMAVDRTGHLYVTQLEDILRMGPGWFAPQPWRELPVSLG
jgi:DNA-binding beta-propeller fold protein YncE